MKLNKKTIILHTVFSGIIAFFFTIFFASGTIAENYTDNTFVAPVFFLVIVFWVIGVLFLIFRHFHTSIRIMWLSIPTGIMIAFLIEVLL